MTDETNNAPDTAAAFGDVIDSLRASRTSHPLHSSRFTPGYDGGIATAIPGDNVILEGDDLEAYAAQMARSDSNIDFAASAQQMDAHVARLDEKLSAGHFDPRTGSRVEYLTGPAREALQRERDQLAEEAKLTRRAAALRTEHRAVEAARRHAIDEADVIRDEFVRGDAHRARLLDEEVARIEAAEVAKQILLRRYASRLG